ncbi:MAG: MBL fold metallo-hydrolase [Betaproteobacteria bacterium RIFCSPLOWO2_12_FULL_62_13]|nr:MAG: MBL fold metallo-hydrolase [Betaproteobacteria bacterium RIFCSPLOWO2_12_FULL_62_13]
MRIRLLGTGTPTPSLKRMCSGYVVESGGDVIVLDHGFGAHHRLLELGIRATDVTHFFCSHLHYDHMGDYPRLLLTRWDQGAGKIPELKVYGPPPIAKVTRALIDPGGAFGPDLIARTENLCSIAIYRARGGEGERKKPAPEVTELKPNDVVHGNGWQVTTAGVSHFGPQLISYGFRLDAPHGSFVYSGDSGPCASMARLAGNCDVLVHMCHYISGTELNEEFAKSCMGHRELAKLGAEANVKTIVLTHVTEQIDQPGVRERVLREMAEIYKGNLIFGDDLMEIPVRGPAAAKLM